MKRKSRVVGWVVVACFVTFSISAGAWHVETLQSDAGPCNSMVLNALSEPRVVYTAGASNYLRYAVYKPALRAWSYETLATNADSSPYSADIVIDSGGKPRIVCDISGAYQLQYRYHDGTAWHAETVLVYAPASWTVTSIDSARIRMAPGGAVWISYRWRWDRAEHPHGSSCQNGIAVGMVPGEFRTVDSDNGYFFDMSNFKWLVPINSVRLAPDGSGHPHLIYNRDDALKYVYESGGLWYTQTVTTVLEDPEFLSLAMKSGGTPGGAFWEWTGLQYATRAGGSWTKEAVASAGAFTRGGISLAYGPNGYPCVAFGDTNRLRFARRGASGWQVQTVESWTGGASTDLTLALNSAGHARISFYHPQADAVKFAAEDPWWREVDLGNGWMWSAWFGYFHVGAHPWVYHKEHKWVFVDGNDSKSGLWMYMPGIGWLWTRDTGYPYLYDANRGAWLWYVKGSVNPRCFFNLKAKKWEFH